MNDNQVIVLNFDYSFLGVVPMERAFLYIAKGKVYIEKFSEKVLTTYKEKFKVPLVVRFSYMVREVYKRKIPWSKRNVLIRDKFTCGYCGKIDKNHMTVDHVFPKSKGGKNTFENTCAACFECNNKKNDKTTDEARMFPKHKLTHPTITEFIRMWYDSVDFREMMATIWE